MAIEIPVGKSHIALVDEADADLVRGFKWYPHTSHGPVIYARAEMLIDGKRVRFAMHRVILDLRPGELTDHLDGNGLNNQRANLRLCTHSENMRNRRKRKRSDSSPYKGVYAKSGRWVAMIRDSERKRQVMIGVFDDPIAAAKAYDVEAVRLFGEFALTNFPCFT